MQTDAAINPRNIGGPLLNLRGEVVGVNSPIVSQSKGFKGIGFVIPSNITAYIVKQLLIHGRLERSRMGVSIQNLTPELVKSFGLEKPEGALIAYVVKGGPADKAGIKRGDVVTGYRGKKIPDSVTLQNEVAASPIEKDVKVTVFRNSKKQTLVVRIENLQEATNTQAFPIKGRLGVDVRPATSLEMARYDLDSHQGLVIISVHPDSPLGKIGFEVEDMMLEINGQPIESPEDFAALVNALGPKQRINLRGLDHRSGRSGYVQVVVP